MDKVELTYNVPVKIDFENGHTLDLTNVPRGAIEVSDDSTDDSWISLSEGDKPIITGEAYLKQALKDTITIPAMPVK